MYFKNVDMMPFKAKQLRLLISFAPVDRALKDKLVQHLTMFARLAGVDLWSADRVAAGQEWRREIADALGRADVALLLISAEFLASEFLQDVELPILVERRRNAGLKVIPVLLRSCHWEVVPWLANLSMLPKDGRAVASLKGDQLDQAMADVSAEIARLAGEAVAYVSPSGDKESDPFFELVANVIAEQLGVFPEEVVAGASFFEDLKADSLGLVEVGVALEETFEIDISDEDSERLRRVGDVYDYLIKRGVAARMGPQAARALISDPERLRVTHRRQGSRVLRQFAQTRFFALYCKAFAWKSEDLLKELSVVVDGRPVHKLTSFPAQSVDDNGDFRTDADGLYMLDEVLIVIVSRPHMIFCTLNKEEGLTDRSYMCADIGIHRTKSADGAVKVVFEDRRGPSPIWNATCRGKAVVATADKVVAELHRVLQESYV